MAIRLSAFIWRRADDRDVRALWAWRNDPSTRRASYTTGRISLREHRAWFEKKKSDSRAVIWIVETADGKALGSVRLDLTAKDEAEVSIVIAPEQRGKGHAQMILRQLPRAVGPKRVRKYIAWVKADNVPSVVAFLRAGFRFTRAAEHRGEPSYVLTRVP